MMAYSNEQYSLQLVENIKLVPTFQRLFGNNLISRSLISHRGFLERAESFDTKTINYLFLEVLHAFLWTDLILCLADLLCPL